MKRNILYTLLLLLVVSMSSCNDHLDIEKHGNMGSMDDFYQTDEEVNEAIASLYLTIKSAYFNWSFITNALSDDAWAAGGQRGDNAELEKLNEYRFGADESMIQGLYSGLYSIIYKANLIIDKTTADTQEKKRAVAEAKFWRAWSHFELVTLWGTAPVVDHLLTADEYRPSNSTPEELWAIVESDLTSSIESGALPSKSDVNDSTTTIRVTKEVAQAMLGKAYLFEKKYNQAADMLNAVISSGKYALYTDNYGNIMHVETNNCCESMLEIQMRDDDTQMWSQFTMQFLMLGWRTDYMSLTGQAASEISTGTYGFMNPRASVYEAFLADEGVDGYRLNNTIKTYDQIKAYGASLQSGVTMYGNEGYFNWKNRALKSDCVTDASYFQALQYIDLRIMRYAEVILLAAEANLEAGNTAMALKQINMIRNRAKLSSLTSVTLDDIKTEKRLELWMENTRYQDLVRWGDAETVLKNQGAEIPSFTENGVVWNYQNSDYGFKAKNKLLPIPMKELELNPNMSQNENW
jgi:hypothetical protein